MSSHTLALALRVSHALDSLRPGEWLTDKAVALAMDRVTLPVSHGIGHINSLATKTFIEGVPTATKNLEGQLHGKQMCLVPVCYYGHWVLYFYEAYNHTSRKVLFFNSLAGGTTPIVDRGVSALLVTILGEDMKKLVRDVEVVKVKHHGKYLSHPLTFWIIC
jgi:hypothetical protein